MEENLFDNVQQSPVKHAASWFSIRKKCHKKKKKKKIKKKKKKKKKKQKKKAKQNKTIKKTERE